MIKVTLCTGQTFAISAADGQKITQSILGLTVAAVSVVLEGREVLLATRHILMIESIDDADALSVD